MGRCEIGGARVYVTTQERCNRGLRFGTWLELKDYSSKKELMLSFREIYSDEQRPVIRYLDWQGIPKNFISETGMSKKLFPLLSEYNKLDATGQIGFCIWLGRHQDRIPDVSPDKIMQAFRGCYRGYFGYRQRFTEYYAKEELGITREGSPRFDFVTFNKYLFGEMYVIDCGYVFRKVWYEIKRTENNGISPQY